MQWLVFQRKQHFSSLLLAVILCSSSDETRLSCKNSCCCQLCLYFHHMAQLDVIVFSSKWMTETSINTRSVSSMKTNQKVPRIAHIVRSRALISTCCCCCHLHSTAIVKVIWSPAIFFSCSELLGPDFTETFYTEDGQPVTVHNHNFSVSTGWNTFHHSCLSCCHFLPYVTLCWLPQLGPSSTFIWTPVPVFYICIVCCT